MSQMIIIRSNIEIMSTGTEVEQHFQTKALINKTNVCSLTK